jgi:hypothetical protein
LGRQEGQRKISLPFPSKRIFRARFDHRLAPSLKESKNA